MSSAQLAFGGVFRQLTELGVVEVITEPLDMRIERRLRGFWENTSGPRCGHHSVQTWPHFDCVRYRDCEFQTGPHVRHTVPREASHLRQGASRVHHNLLECQIPTTDTV